VTLPRLPDRDTGQVDALVADRYLDALLAAGELRPADLVADDALEPELRDAARVLRRALVRVHPSFRFEERLATRLADLAVTQGAQAAQAVTQGAQAAQAAPALARTGGGTVIRFPGSVRTADGDVHTDPLLEAILRGDLDPTDEAAVDDALPEPPARRPRIVGGAAITSAALSIVGVAFVAWRATRPTRPAGRSADLMGPA
jgi:hypothetical protein